MKSLMNLFIAICCFGVAAVAIDYVTTIAPFEIKIGGANTDRKYFTSLPDLKRELISYCEDPDNYDTTEYGCVIATSICLYF